MPKRRGRPYAFWPVMATLEDERLYTVGQIAMHALDTGQLGEPKSFEAAARYETLLESLRIVSRSKLPSEPDGKVPARNQRYRWLARAWYGWRWKRATDPNEGWHELYGVH